jgi:hypothetical protein
MSPENDYQRKARLEREARQKAQAKQREREKRALDRAESIARERSSPEQYQHLAEAARRVAAREGRIGSELGRALENRIKNGPNKMDKGSIGRLVGLGNRMFGDGRNGIDLAQQLIAYGNELEKTWKAFGSYTPPQPVKETRAQEMERTQREREQHAREAQAQNIEQVRYLMGVTYGDSSSLGKLTPEVRRDVEERNRSRIRESRDVGARERGRGGRGD